jgi:amino acid permease
MLSSDTNADTVAQFLSILKLNLSNTFVVTAIYTFISISVTTAFITLSLALKDLILDKSKIKYITNPKRNIILSFLLFILPIMINYYFEQLFLIALSVVGLFSLIMLVTCPLNMVRILRNRGYNLIYTSMKSRTLNILAITISVTIIIFQIVDYLI